MSERARAEAILHDALAIESASRDAFIREACADDATLERLVRALVAAHERDGVLDRRADALLDRAIGNRNAEPATPATIGPYRVVREVARGGMAVVYDGERVDGQFRRRVAIKVLLGSGADMHDRIGDERRILAALDHPDIARLLDGGVTAAGRPYLVMEYVDGLPIDVYCDRLRLTVRERLRIFITVARAVHFAHQNLVVHRDLKPSNIFIMPNGQVKLLDFGIAALLNPLLSSAAPLALEHALTPEYASPEQSRGEPLRTTSDVYSLGVLLYELLTGNRPATAPPGRMQESRGHASDDGLVSASACVHWLDPARALQVATARHTTPQRLARMLGGDLDAILAMALRAEPQRRYASAELLAQDVERHLEMRPVRARAQGGVYALDRLIRRHRISAVSLAVAVLALLTGAGAAVWQAAEAGRERDRATAALAQSEEVSRFLIELFSAGTPSEDTRGSVTAREIARRGAARIEQLAHQPAVQMRMLATLGRVHETLGDYEEGQRLTQRALAIHDGLARTDEAQRAQLLVQLGILQRRRGEYDSAQTAFAAARSIQERVLPPGDTALARTYTQLSSIAVYQGDNHEALRRANAALELHRTALGENDPLTISSLTQVALMLRRLGQRDSSELLLRRAIELRRTTPRPTPVEMRTEQMHLADLISQDPANRVEAERLYRAVLAAAVPTEPEWYPLAVWVRGSLAILEERNGDVESAERRLREALAMRSAVAGSTHPSAAEGMGNLAGLLVRHGRLEEAERLFRDASAIFLAAFGDRHPVHATSVASHAAVLLRMNRLAEADSLLGAVVVARGERAGRMSHLFAEALLRHAEVRTRLGAHDDALAMLTEALNIAGSVDIAPWLRRAIHEHLASLYTRTARPADAARHRSLAAQVTLP